MSTITLPNIRVSSDLTVKVRLKDSEVAIDWSTLTKIKASIYSDAQRALAGRCDVSIDAEDSTLLVCNYAANKPQYVGVNRIVVSAKYMGETKTYDKPAFNFVRWTADQEGEQITIDDPDVDVEISVEDISSSILQEAVDAAFEAADRANDAAAAAEHMVDIHTGPEGKSAYEVAVEEGYVGTEEEWLASLVGPQGAQGIQGETGEAAGFGTVSVSLQEDGGQPSATVAASGTDTAKNFAFTFNNLKGEKGDKGDQGNTGSSVEYPYELVNNLTTNDATKGLTAAMGVTLEGEVSQLEAKVYNLYGSEIFTLDGFFSASTGTFNSHSSWKSTDKIRLYGKPISGYFYLPSTASNGAATFFKEDGSFAGEYHLGTANLGLNTIPTTAFPQDAAFVAIATLASSIANSYVNYGVPSAYILRDKTEDKIFPLITKIEDVDIFIQQGFYNATTGVYNSNPSWRCTPKMRLFGKDIRGKFYLPSTASNGAVVFFKADGTYAGEYHNANNTGVKENLIPVSAFPAGAAYVAIATLASELTGCWVDLGVNSSITLSEVLNERADKLDAFAIGQGKSLFSIDGYFDASTGEFHSSTSAKTTPILPINGDIFARVYLGANTYYYFGFAFYDENKDYISGYTGTDVGLQNVKLTSANYPVGAKYFAVSTLNQYLSEATLKCDIDVAAYELSSSAPNVSGKTIVCFGDSLTEMVDTTNSKHYTDYLADMTGANIVNVGIGGSQIRKRLSYDIGVFDSSKSYAIGDFCIHTNGSNETRLYKFTLAHTGSWDDNDVILAPYQQNAYSLLDIYSLIKASCEQSFTDVVAACKVIKETQSDDNTAIIDRLVAIDWSKVDAITIFAGTNDWYGANTLGTTGSNDANKTLGAINEIIRLFLTAYPQVKVFWFTPVVRWVSDFNVGTNPPTIDDTKFSDNYSVEGNRTLKDESVAIIQEVTKNHIPVCDMYNNFGWNKYNCKLYFVGTDGTHPRTYAGVTYLAKKIGEFILANNTL